MESEFIKWVVLLFAPVICLVTVLALGTLLGLYFRRPTTDAVSNQVTSNPEATPMSATFEKIDLESFNQKFVAANQALTRGDSAALRTGISLFIESLNYAGDYTPHILRAIEKLRGALSHHDCADTKGPWNRDLSGYGVVSWKADLYDRDQALRLAWEDISCVNESLKAEGLGWHY